MFAWFFLSALYLQLVLGYSPLQVGLAFLPGNLIMGALSIGISAKLVMRFGIKHAARRRAAARCRRARAVRARAGRTATSCSDVLPSMILLGLGAGIAFNPVLLAAMSDVEPQEAGPRLGHRQHRVHDGRRARPRGARKHRGVPHLSLPTAGHCSARGADGGYHVAFLGGTICAALAAVVGVVLLHEARDPGFAHGERRAADPVFDAD